MISVDLRTTAKKNCKGRMYDPMIPEAQLLETSRSDPGAHSIVVINSEVC